MKTSKLEQGSEPMTPSDIKLLNPDKKLLTKEKYRELTGRHDLSDEDADQAAQNIQLFAKTLYEFIAQNKHI